MALCSCDGEGSWVESTWSFVSSNSPEGCPETDRCHIGDNQIDGREKEGNMPVLSSGQNNYLRVKNMTIFCHFGITIDEKMIPHNIIYLHINNNKKGGNSNVVRCGNQREFFALVIPTIFRIISQVFRTKRNRRCWIWASYISSLFFFLLGASTPSSLQIFEFMRWVGFWIYMTFWVGISDRCGWLPITPPVMHIWSRF